MYLLPARAARRNATPFEDPAAVASVARGLAVEFRPGDLGDVGIFLEGQEVSDDIRTERAGNDASRVAAVPAVRDALLARQRAFRQAPGLVADGRDMGTTVFPDAALKIFLAATAEVRAQRRYKQLKEKGLDANLRSLYAEIAERDERDRNRAVSPLKPADDAVVIDTSELGIEQVLAAVLAHCRTRLGLQ